MLKMPPDPRKGQDAQKREKNEKKGSLKRSDKTTE